MTKILSSDGNDKLYDCNYKSYGLFIDLSIGNSINEAIQFKSEKHYDLFADNITSKNPTYEVGIKRKDGTVEIETFHTFKRYFFNQPKN